MGVNVRFADGTKRYIETWTNAWPGFFLDVDNIPWDEIDKEYTNKRWSTPHKSEYGVLFIDYMNKVIYSRQGYCKPCKIMLDVDPTYWDQTDIDSFQKLGEYARENRIPEQDTITDLASFVREAACVSSIGTRTSGFIVIPKLVPYIKNKKFVYVSFNPLGWTVDHKSHLDETLKSIVKKLGW